MSTLAGTGPLVRLVLRRDRIRLPVWVLLLGLLPALTASSLKELFGTDAALAGYAAGVSANPAVQALQGPIFGSSLGAATAGRILTNGALVVALISALTVVRHTRAEEESGRRELLGATVVGRHAPLTAALVVVLAANLVLAAITAAGLVAVGLPATGSVAFGLALAAAGWMFAGVAAVTAQLAESSRAANGSALALLGVAYLVRAAGDANPDASSLGWISPLGWPARVRPFADERWWVLGCALAVAVILVWQAYALSAMRDIGAGVIPARPGRADAPRTLRSAFGLAVRLQRGLLLAWAVAFALIGAAFGGVAQGIEQLLDTSPQIKEILAQLGGGGSIVDVFLAAEFGVLGLVSSVYAVQATLRMRVEETGQRAEPVLATAVGRIRWAAGHVAFALLGPAVVLAAAGSAAGLVHGARIGDVGGQVSRLVGAALVQLPAVWVLAAIAVALFGLLPRLTMLAWAAIVACLVVGQLGQLLRLSQWAMDASPFTHIPKLPGAEVTVSPLAWLVAVAAVIVLLGLVGWRRRDLAA